MLERRAQRVGLQELRADRRFEPRQLQIAAQFDDIAQMVVEVALALADRQADFLLRRGKRARVYVTHKSHPFFRCVGFSAGNTVPIPVGANATDPESTASAVSVFSGVRQVSQAGLEPLHDANPWRCFLFWCGSIW